MLHWCRFRPQSPGVVPVSLGLVCVALLGAPVLAAQASEARAKLWATTDEEIALADLLDAYVAVKDLPLEYDRGALSRRVTLRDGPGLTDDALWTLINRLLAEDGLACIQAAGESGLGIVPLEQAAKVARVEPGGVELSMAGYVKVLHTLSRASPDSVVDVLRNVLAGDGALLQSIPDAGQLLLAGLKP